MKNQDQTNINFDYDVIIVGCGPAGSITARYIEPNKNDLNVLIIDRKKKIGTPVQCGEGILGFLEGHEVGSDTYDKKGLFECPEEIKAHKIERLQFITPKHKIIEIPVGGYTIHRDLLDEYLALRAQKNGAVIKKGVTFLGFKDNHTLLTNVGEISGNIIVGADGPLSSVAKYGGFQPPNIFAKCIFSKIYGDFNDHTMKLFYGNMFKMGYGWIFSKGNHANVGIGTDFYNRKSKKKYTLRTIFNEFIKKELNVKDSDIFFRGGGLVPTCGLVPKFVKENILLVGDAAGMVHPSTGAGIDSAMVAGRECGNAILRYFLNNADLANYEIIVRNMFEKSYQKGLRIKKMFQLVTSNNVAFEMVFWLVKKIGVTKFIM